MKSLLVLEPDRAELEQLKSIFGQHYPGLTIDYHETPQRALEAFEGQHHNLVITELVLDGEIDGLEFIERILASQPHTVIYVISDFPALDDISRVLSGLSNVRFFRKPLSIEAFFEVVAKTLARLPNSIVTGINPVNFLQMMEMERFNGYLEVATESGVGYLCFDQGMVRNASHRNKSGTPALYDLLAETVTEIRVFEGLYRFERNINTPLSTLLIDFCQKTDESANRSAQAA